MNVKQRNRATKDEKRVLAETSVTLSYTLPCKDHSLSSIESQMPKAGL